MCTIKDRASDNLRPNRDYAKVSGFEKESAMNELRIGSKVVSSISPVYIIAEIGVNHNGKPELAKQMISAAKDCGADAVKFQTYSSERLLIPKTPKVSHQKSTTSEGESHFDMLKRLELPKECYPSLLKLCQRINIDFISTPYDIPSARFLLELGVPCFKTASFDIVDLPLHTFLAESGKPVIISTGTATLGEIEEVMNIYGSVTNAGVVLLHCVSNYPCADASLNLRAIKTIGQAFSVNVGFSDHTVGALAACIAVGLGANVIEKHFTLDQTLPGPDHKASATPDEFKDLVSSLRRTEVMLGSPDKRCQSEESALSRILRKSIVTNKNIKKGERVLVDCLAVKRPGTGLHPREIENIIGKKARYALAENHIINWADIE